MLQEQDVFNKQFARRMAMMIESRLIWYKHYYLWTDEVIMAREDSPEWVLRLATTKYIPDAVGIINEFVYSEPFEFFDDDVYTDEYLACLFLRYTRGELSWATFLREAGDFTDGQNSHRQCEDFYCDLNILEANEFAKSIEHSQRAEFEQEYAPAIASIQPLYLDFLEYFRRFVKNEAEKELA